MSDNKITQDQLESNVMEELESGIGDLSTLSTENKDSLVAAVTEIYGKNVIAEAIGEPLAVTDTFSEMGSEINSLLSSFKTNMMNSGVTVESGDKFKQLIEKIKGLTEGEGNKGIQFAEGTGSFTSKSDSNYDITLDTPFGFLPTYVFIEFPTGYASMNVTQSIADNGAHYVTYSSSGGVSGYAKSFNDTSVTIYCLSTRSALIEYKWYAIGVGEEDTTLRDSLASILEEEGVSVTEEDDMASLITKVDEEFNVNRDRLYELMSEGGYDVNSGMNLDSLIDLLVLSGISISGIKQIACGENYTVILKNDGSVWSCGANNYGQLGLNTTSKTTFTQVTTNINNDVKQIACSGGHTFILKNDGSVWGCGSNLSGQLGLGDNDTNTHKTFTQVTTNINNDVKQIACGGANTAGFTFIIKNDGSVWVCGSNSYGQLGLGDTTERHSFTQVTINISDVKQIACGQYHTFILKNDGSVWSCGRNNDGKLGLGDTTDRTTFTQVTTNINNDVKQVACGGSHTIILKNDGTVWSCGNNGSGQLGLNNTTNKTSFTQVTTNINNDVKEVACGGNHTFILKNDGTVWSCGSNGQGQLGLGNSGSSNNKTSFTQVTTNINNDVKEIVCGGNHTFILKNDDTVWSCGYNDGGQLGLGTSDTISNIFTMIPRGVY